MNATTSAIKTPFRPLAALRAVQALRTNPDDTRQIFMIFQALGGRSSARMFARFRNSLNGQRFLSEERSLLKVLTDRNSLAELPAGSVGRAYLAFMESENLSAEGLVEASEGRAENAPPQEQLFLARMRDAHDLTHILTGYGRDPLGELCLLAFMNRHTRNPGQLLIIAMSWLQVPKSARPAIREAYRNGAKARWLVDQDYEALLARPLNEVRSDLGIRPPLLYESMQS
ncbi:hypothetical protein GRI39_04765 [Altererythrobacter indicus]|uniref:Ubiquinone biosynthesis protein n=1 Tax=Altericroceibacterium indicum TaxID=374177 RepID=A0A845ADV4_9SPHN|nr:Coq4 family protein [Altericroceibacterium indicum]MXP25358.1 hypothetical protein [Altericroceibacterium indicum]